MSSDGLAVSPWPLATSVLGVKNLRIRPHGSTQKAHLVLRRVTRDDIDSELSDEEEGPVYFSFFAKKRIECKPGKEIFVSLNTSEFEDDRFGEQCVIFEADTTGTGENEVEALVTPLHIERKKAKSVTGEKAHPTKKKSYASIGVQTESTQPARVQPPFSSISQRRNSVHETHGLLDSSSSVPTVPQPKSEVMSPKAVPLATSDSRSGTGQRSAPIFIRGETFPSTFGLETPSRPVLSPIRVHQTSSLTPVSIGSSVHSPVYSPVLSPTQIITKLSRSPTPIDLTSAFSSNTSPNEYLAAPIPSPAIPLPEVAGETDSLASTPPVSVKRELMSPALVPRPLKVQPSTANGSVSSTTRIIIPISIPFNDAAMTQTTSSMPNPDVPVPSSSNISSTSTLFNPSNTPAPPAHESPQSPFKPLSKRPIVTQPKAPFVRMNPPPSRASYPTPSASAQAAFSPLELSPEIVNLSLTSPRMPLSNGLPTAHVPSRESPVRIDEGTGPSRAGHLNNREIRTGEIAPDMFNTISKGLASLPPRPEPIPIPLFSSPISSRSTFRGIKREREPSIELLERPPVRQRKLPDKAMLQCVKTFTVYPERRGVDRPSILDMRLNKAGTRLALICSDNTLRVWDGRGGGPIRRHRHRTKIVGMEWVGKHTVLFLDCDAMVCQYSQMDPTNNESWEVFDILDVSSYCSSRDERLCFAFHPGLKRVAVGFADMGLVVWEQNDKTWVRLMCARELDLNVIKFVPNGSAIICGTSTGDLLSIYPDSRVPTFSRLASLHSKIGGLDLDYTGDIVLVTTADGSAALYHTSGHRHGEFLGRMTCSSFSYDTKVSFDATFISRDVVIHGVDGSCALVWDLNRNPVAMRGEVVWGFDHPESGDEVLSVLYYRGGKNGFIISGTKRGRLYWWPFASEP